MTSAQHAGTHTTASQPTSIADSLLQQNCQAMDQHPLVPSQAGEQAQAGLRDSLAAAQQAQQDSGSAIGDSPGREAAASEQLAELQGEADILREALEVGLLEEALSSACSLRRACADLVESITLCNRYYMVGCETGLSCRCSLVPAKASGSEHEATPQRTVQEHCSNVMQIFCSLTGDGLQAASGQEDLMAWGPG